MRLQLGDDIGPKQAENDVVLGIGTDDLLKRRRGRPRIGRLDIEIDASIERAALRRKFDEGQHLRSRAHLCAQDSEVDILRSHTEQDLAHLSVAQALYDGWLGAERV